MYKERFKPQNIRNLRNCGSAIIFKEIQIFLILEEYLQTLFAVHIELHDQRKKQKNSSPKIKLK